MRTILCASALALACTVSVGAFEVPAEVLELERAFVLDSAGAPMDNCCIHEEDAGFMGYPPNLWYDSSTHYINCPTLTCLEEAVGRITRETLLQILLQKKIKSLLLKARLGERSVSFWRFF